jgi:hypothetical protein
MGGEDGPDHPGQSSCCQPIQRQVVAERQSRADKSPASGRRSHRAYDSAPDSAVSVVSAARPSGLLSTEVTRGPPCPALDRQCTIGVPPARQTEPLRRGAAHPPIASAAAAARTVGWVGVSDSRRRRLARLTRLPGPPGMSTPDARGTCVSKPCDVGPRPYPEMAHPGPSRPRGHCLAPKLIGRVPGSGVARRVLPCE